LSLATFSPLHRWPAVAARLVSNIIALKLARKFSGETMNRPITFEAAKAQFPHRYTCEHVPTWAKQQAPNGKWYAPQFATDKQWYDSTKFYGESEFVEKSHCYTSGQIWPHGQWLLTCFERNSADWRKREHNAREAAAIEFASTYETSRPDLYEVRT
jgi:hypothetical protein